MTELPTPSGFVAAVHEIKTARTSMVLYLDPRTKHCRALSPTRRRPAGNIRIGVYDVLVLGSELARIAREDVERSLWNIKEPKRNKHLSQSHAGRRSV